MIMFEEAAKGHVALTTAHAAVVKMELNVPESQVTGSSDKL